MRCEPPAEQKKAGADISPGYIFVLGADGELYNFGGDQVKMHIPSQARDYDLGKGRKEHYAGVSVRDFVATKRIELSRMRGAEKLVEILTDVYDFKALRYSSTMMAYKYESAEAVTPYSKAVREKREWQCKKIAPMPFTKIEEEP